MIEFLEWKSDFGRTVQRFAAWWQGELIDRALVTLNVRQATPPAKTGAHPAGMRQAWMDVQYVVDRAIAAMGRRAYIGDSYPLFWPNLGPDICATLFGSDLQFAPNTSWSSPVVHSPDDWRRIIDSKPDFDNEYWQTIERMTDYAIEICQGRYIVGVTDLHGNYDLLAALRDPQALCMDMLDCPDLVRRAGALMADTFNRCLLRLWAKLKAAGMGCTTWLPAYHTGPCHATSCDFWCMVSPQMAREMVLPDIVTEMKHLERSIFHLDGPRALPHLDLLLQLPNLQAIQWVYGAGQGPAARWMDVYRRIRAAGKSVMVCARDGADALAVLQEIGPRGVWLSIEQPFATADDARAFVQDVERNSARKDRS